MGMEPPQKAGRQHCVQNSLPHPCTEDGSSGLLSEWDPWQI